MRDAGRFYDLLVVQHPDVGEVFTVRTRASRTRPQSVRRGVAMLALVNLIRDDPRWQLFDAWGEETGLVAEALEARRVLYDESGPRSERAAAAGARIGDLLDEQSDKVAGLAQTFITATLKYPPWRQLAAELAIRFVVFVAASAMGPLDAGRAVVEPGRQAPRVFLGEFRTRPRETAEAALKRIDAHIADADKARRVIAAAAKPQPKHRDRMPTAEGAKIRRNVEWMYRVDTGLATISDLAREYHGGEPRDFVAGDDSKVVRVGIRTARRDLGMPGSGK